MHLARGLSSKLIIPPSVRASVRPPPRGSSKPMLLHHTVWDFRKSPMYFTILSYGRLQNTPWNWYFFRQLFKTHHKMIGWNREFQYLPAKIIGKIVKYQYLPAKTIHFSLSHLTLSSLSHIPLSPLFSWLWFHSQSLLDSPYLNLFSCISPEGWARSWLFLRASVRPSPSSGKLKTYAFAPYCLKFQKITYVFYST